jgi:hypothetical protein
MVDLAIERLTTRTLGARAANKLAKRATTFEAVIWIVAS